MQYPKRWDESLRRKYISPKFISRIMTIFIDKVRRIYLVNQLLTQEFAGKMRFEESE